MAEYDSSNVAFFVVDGYDILPFSGSLTDPGEVCIVEDRTPLGATLSRKAALALIEPVSIEQTGWYDDGAAIADAIDGKRNDLQTLCWGLTGNLTGRDFVGVTGTLRRAEKPVERGTLLHTSLGWEAETYGRGRIIAPLSARGAAGHTQATPVDDGAASAAGAELFLALTALTLGGYTNLVVRVTHSVDGLTWTDLGTFTARTAIGAQRVVVTGTVRQYLAVSWSWTGAGANPSATFVVGAARN